MDGWWTWLGGWGGGGMVAGWVTWRLQTFSNIGRGGGGGVVVVMVTCHRRWVVVVVTLGGGVVAAGWGMVVVGAGHVGRVAWW